MYKNYFYFLRCVNELEPHLKGKRILEIYTQEKNKLFLHLPSNDKPFFHLIISVNPQQPYLTFKDEHHKAKKNTTIIFSEVVPVRVESTHIAFGDRIILFALDNAKLIVFFRGAQSNIYMIGSDGVLQSFKKNIRKEKKEILNEIDQLLFINSIENFLEKIKLELDEEQIRKLQPIGKEILREIDSRTGDFKKIVSFVLEEISTSKIVVYYDEEINRPRFVPFSFNTLKIPEKHFLFENYSDALNKYFSLLFTKNKAADIRKQIEKFLSSETERLANKLNNLKARIEAGSKEYFYRKNADLLLANISHLKKGMKEITLDDFVSIDKTRITLDEKLSPQKNVEKYYDKSRSEKVEFGKSEQFFLSVSKDYDRLIKIREKFDKTDNHEGLLAIKNELKMKTPHSPTEHKSEKYSFRHYILSGKYHIYVGKDSKNNDQLTMRFAKQNDFWFHARSVSGSHVILRVENTKEVIPKDILRNAASVAAFYSKAKTSKLASVTYTLKKYVVKNQRQEPGQVTVTKENVLLVKPEIPISCEIVLE